MEVVWGDKRKITTGTRILLGVIDMFTVWLWWSFHGCIHMSKITKLCNLIMWSILYCSWRRKWQPTAVLLPGESHGGRSLVGYSPWGRQESDATEPLHFTIPQLGSFLKIHRESSRQECSFPPLSISLTSVLAFQLSFSSHINHWFILKYGWSPNSSKNVLSPTHTPKLHSQENEYSVSLPYLSAALSYWGQSACVYMLKVKSYIHKKYDQSYWPSLLT